MTKNYLSLIIILIITTIVVVVLANFNLINLNVILFFYPDCCTSINISFLVPTKRCQSCSLSLSMRYPVILIICRSLSPSTDKQKEVLLKCIY